MLKLEQKTALEERWQKILPEKLLKELKKRDPNLMKNDDSLGTCSVVSKSDDTSSFRGSISRGTAMPKVSPFESEDTSVKDDKDKETLYSEKSRPNPRVNIFKGQVESRRYTTNVSSDNDQNVPNLILTLNDAQSLKDELTETSIDNTLINRNKTSIKVRKATKQTPFQNEMNKRTVRSPIQR